MSAKTENSYWWYVDVEPEQVGLQCLAPVKPNEPLRECELITVDMGFAPPFALVEDEHGQKWQVQVPQMWFETLTSPND